ncbi:hypothetical protein H4CHR_04454 [Variovorax sp. PBS-H4]|uniref:DUF6502 family protein n=1 Tax=Variovorax sp. PBS-H4 TaxID=434008 RepID=UPI0013160D1E|nr:DUF6502 family protein [Variovorax sp. PBS-H4]VTU38541.1 hypothetical protein H4CHR_04454 [Variovorax sp. PBS-H4]
MENQLAWALAACARVMRPVVRLALAMGVKHPHLEELLRDLLLSEARRSWQAQGVRNPNLSQLSVSTGLNRKAVTSKVRELGEALPHTEMSAAAKTFTLWLQMLAEHPEHRRLPIVAEAGVPSFETVARQASRGNMHHRAILDELVRLNMVAEHEGRVEITAEAFVPAKDLQSMLAFFGDNARDHLLAAVSNTLGERAPLLERAVYANGVTLQDCQGIEQLVRQRWSSLHHELTHEMTRAVTSAAGSASGRIRVGIYTYYEAESTDPAEAGSGVPPTAQEGKK